MHHEIPLSCFRDVGYGGVPSLPPLHGLQGVTHQAGNTHIGESHKGGPSRRMLVGVLVACMEVGFDWDVVAIDSRTCPLLTSN